MLQMSPSLKVLEEVSKEGLIEKSGRGGRMVRHERLLLSRR